MNEAMAAARGAWLSYRRAETSHPRISPTPAAREAALERWFVACELVLEEYRKAQMPGVISGRI